MPYNTSQANNIPTEPYRSLARVASQAREAHLSRSVVRPVNTDQLLRYFDLQPLRVASTPPPPRARGWVLITTRAGLEFSESPYTNNTQSMALAKFVKSAKGNITDHVNLVNTYLGEIARLKQVITKAEALVVDDSVPVSPAAPGEPRASEQPASEQLASDSDTWGAAEPDYDSSIDTEVAQALAVNSSGTTPEAPEPTISAFDAIPDAPCGDTQEPTQTGSS
jgi:hypothetical protein